MSDLQENEEQGKNLLKRLAHRARRVRSWVHQRPGGAQIWRVGVGLLGLVVIVVGIVLLPLPGPGWAIIFLGLGIWATEFDWARSLLNRVRREAARWAAWAGRQSRGRKVLAGTTGVLVLGAAAVGYYLVAT